MLCLVDLFYRVVEIEGKAGKHPTFSSFSKHSNEEKNVIGKRATVDVPVQRDANITMCPAISTDGLLLHKPLIGPYNTARLLAFLHDLYGRVVLGE